MPQYPCTITECPRISRALCHCCQNNYCIEHLRDHNDTYLSQLYELTNQINKLSEYFRGQHRLQLDQWRQESHQAIDSYYEKKCQELDKKSIQNETVNQDRQVLEWIKLKITQLIREQNTTQQQIDSLKAATNAVQREIEQIPKERFQLNIPSLVFDDNFILIGNKQSNFNLHSIVKSLYLTKDISTDSSIVMAANAKYFLISQKSYLYLYDKKLYLIKEIPWEHGCIWDMCMSNTLSKFILTAKKGIITLDEQTMIVEEIKSLPVNDRSWYCCACSNKSLFLATQNLNTTIYEYSIMEKNFSFRRKQLCCSSDEYIEHMKCTNDCLALIILNDTKNERHLDIRSTLTFDQLWTISLNIHEQTNIVSCCSLNENGWLIVDVAETRLIHVTNQGYIKNTITYTPSPHYAVQFDNDTLAILTEQGINLHRIDSDGEFRL
ncbi:unnamed protein product [Rotaria socialis]|uniref:Uncharacterized protein n=2 Tax=Rotaria socialis TaxID=392032 RepID=A0A820VTD6_9BILA|nr:unnamed protein product [Rotaria socialis]CAF4506647.1 unnamed protein product [Rotaria socialis]